MKRNYDEDERYLSEAKNKTNVTISDADIYDDYDEEDEESEPQKPQTKWQRFCEWCRWHELGITLTIVAIVVPTLWFLCTVDYIAEVPISNKGWERTAKLQTWGMAQHVTTNPNSEMNVVDSWTESHVVSTGKTAYTVSTTYYVYEQEEWITVEEFPTSGRNDEPYWGINNAQTFAQVDNPTIGDCRYDFSDEHYYVTVGVSSQLQEMPYDKWQQTNIGDTVEVTFGSYFEYLFNTIGVRK